MSLRNLPTDEAQQLAALITARPGQVSSMGLTPVDSEASIMLFSYTEGESISEERYSKDVLYFAVEGSFDVVFADKAITLNEGDVLKVGADVEHAIEPTGLCKVLQILA